MYELQKEIHNLYTNNSTNWNISSRANESPHDALVLGIHGRPDGTFKVPGEQFGVDDDAVDAKLHGSVHARLQLQAHHSVQSVKEKEKLIHRFIAQHYSVSTCTHPCLIQWIPVIWDRFLQPKKSRLTKNPLYPKLFMYYHYVVNGLPI